MSWLSSLTRRSARHRSDNGILSDDPTEQARYREVQWAKSPEQVAGEIASSPPAVLEAVLSLLRREDPWVRLILGVGKGEPEEVLQERYAKVVSALAKQGSHVHQRTGELPQATNSRGTSIGQRTPQPSA